MRTICLLLLAGALSSSGGERLPTCVTHEQNIKKSAALHTSHASETSVYLRRVPGKPRVPLADPGLKLRGGWAHGAGGGGAVAPAKGLSRKACGISTSGAKSGSGTFTKDLPSWTMSPPEPSPPFRLMPDLDEPMPDAFSLERDCEGTSKRPDDALLPQPGRGGKALRRGEKVVGILGNGAFGTVYATELPDKKCVAVKVQRAGGKYAQVTFDEIELLKAVSRAREEAKGAEEDLGGDCVVELLDTFQVVKPHKQMCLAFEMLGPSLLDLVIDHGYRGIPLALAKTITRHALRGLNFLHKKCNIIHTDVKPENILLNFKLQGESISDWWAKHSEKGAKNSKQPWKLQPAWSHGLPPAAVGAKLVDLGNSCFADRHYSDNIQTIEYRSPEVIIGAGYSFAADIWSLACTVFELVTGEYLFDPQEGRDAQNELCWSRDEDLLAHHQELLGMFPREFALSGKQSPDLFDAEGALKRITGLRFWGLKEVLMEKYGMVEREAAQLTDFLVPMLSPDPAHRACAEERLQHEWLAA